MADRNDDKISMPSSGAGLTKYFDDYESALMFSPESAMFVILGFALAMVLLTF